MATFAPVAFVNKETGDRAEGEFVLETSNAWQAAVRGKVRVFLKSEWEPAAPHRGRDIFGDVFGGFPYRTT